MKLTTPRFGTLAYVDEQIIDFPSGVLMTPESGHFLVVDDSAYAPFQWLVCVERPEYAVTILDPAVVFNDASGAPSRTAETSTFVVATPGNGDVAWWLDLRHPILIHNGERKGEQVTLDDRSLPEQFPVTLQQQHETAE
jgi:flagellar assembly factor FliW